MIVITLKDNSKKKFDKEVSILEVAKSISEGLARNACGAIVNGEVRDLRDIIKEDAEVSILTFDDEEGKNIFRHTTAHVLAYAVKRLFKDVKLGMGPAIEDGFYYDFKRDKAFTTDELKEIESEMKKIVKENNEMQKFVLKRDEAIKLVKDNKEDYKLDIIENLEDKEFIFYKQGDFIDLCKGPHLVSLKNIKALKITSENGSSGAYWKSDEKNEMLNRIYGTSFPKASELENFLNEREEAKKRDHNKLGRELKFFTTSEIVGQGLPLIMPKGAKVLQLLQRFVEDEEQKRGYELTKTPLMAKNDLYKVSGHWSHYKEGMFILSDEEKDKEVLALRPMTCPFQFIIYNAEQHSYKDLPKRYAETSTLFRNEASGEMHGLIRLRQFTISEGHIICTEEQLAEEFKRTLELVNFMMESLGIEEDIYYRFSKWDHNNKEKYVGEEDSWENIQNLMKDLLIELNIEFKEAEGEAAFYGPKLDIQFKNVHGKEDTIITIQIDFSLAKRFDMTYVDKDSIKKHPVIIHRTSIGCYERTLAMLIEKYSGALPLWLSPTQIKVLPISDKFNGYADFIIEQFENNNIRIEGDFRGEKIGYKIREARMERVPYIFVIGEKEMEEKTVSVRSRFNGEEGSINLDEILKRIISEVKIKK